MSDRSTRLLLLASVFVIATCGLIYELIAGTLASYLLGDSVTQFSTIIGVYLFAMGVGSWLSRFVGANEALIFVRVQLLIGVLGGCSAAVLFVLFAHVASFRVLLYGLIGLVGTLVGLEIPLLLRILKDRLEFKDLVAQVFTFDYIGALLASLLFPLVLVPGLGLVRSAFLFGALNVAVGWMTLRVLRLHGPPARMLEGTAAVLLLLLAAGFAAGGRILEWSERSAFEAPVIHARSTPYQRIVLTRHGDDLRLHLNGNLQFSARDEYRYHEALVHPGLARMPEARRVLVLGGGDGLAVREVLRHAHVDSVMLVDLDPEMTRLFSTQALLTDLNAGALTSPRVRIANADAFAWLGTNTQRFDFVVVDFPDPSNFSLGKLFTTTFYERLRTALAPGGAVVVQATSPLVARRAFWCVDATLRRCGFQTEPYHVYVPSFGEWGFILASLEPLPELSALPAGLKFLTVEGARDLFRFPPDMDRVPTEVNRLNNQVLVRYFEEEWGRYAP
ncbi:MAG: polyamine aminopropyltransferase [Verrucomicrobia bacterium]|nr:polyamine aminopropyltransferase [Verrucomicrobiota bacterium]